MSTVTEVVEAALTLTEDDRSLLVEIVLSSLDAPDFDDSELEGDDDEDDDTLIEDEDGDDDLSDIVDDPDVGKDD